MPAYRLVFKPSAERSFLALPKPMQQRLDKKLLALEADPRPRGIRALAGASGVYRLRVGDYRVLYEVHDADVVVLVLAVGHRSQVSRSSG